MYLMQLLGSLGMLTVVGDIFDGLGEIIQGFIDLMKTLFADTGIIAVFYTDATGLTFIGVLLLIAFGYGLVRWAFGWVRKLLQLRG